MTEFPFSFFLFWLTIPLKPSKKNCALSLFLIHHLSVLALRVVFAASCDWWRGVVTPVRPLWVEIQLLEGRNAGGVAALHMVEVPGSVSVSVWVRPCGGRGRWGVSAFRGGQTAHRTALAVGVITCVSHTHTNTRGDSFFTVVSQRASSTSANENVSCMGSIQKL